ncbi:MAG: cell envelope integrity protein CreD [Acidobacteria bacterium]|nr:MAG: cell envelope integrity protein CreD [Acidobacteriota bacterium]
MTNQGNTHKMGDFVRNSATIKIFSIGFLVLILLIPTAMVSSIIREREERKDSVVQEINQKWGYRQIVSGPFFTVPYKSFYKDEQDKLQFSIVYLHILPDSLNISGAIEPHIRYRSIYEAILYNTRVNISGRFKIPELNQSNINPNNILWEKATFSVGIADMRGIQDNIDIVFNEKQYKANPGLKTNDIASSGVHSYIPLSQTDSDLSFSFQLNLNGSEELHFIPLGKTTHLELESNWPSPSFNGAYLPTNRQVSDKGFTAEWNVLHLNRNFPQFWLGNQYMVSGSAFGLKLLINADIYQKSIRVSKYAVMFIVFTFAAFFFSEVLNRKRIHPIQYLLIGFAVIVFYVLLLSISEHVNFNTAYFVSAFAITAMITAYSNVIIKNPKFTITVFVILAILYGYLYIVIQLEDFALIMGSIGLFVLLATVMYITRKIDWYTLEKGSL